MNSTLPGCSAAAAPLPPFDPVQVVPSLPSIPQLPVQTEPSTSPSKSVRSKEKRENLTGLTRAEIRLLAEAVESHRTWRGELVGHGDPAAEQALAEFDARVDLMRAAIRKLKVASGIRFSGKSGRKA